MKLLIGWLINTLSLFIATKIVPGISVDDTTTLFLSSLVIGIVNTLIKPFFHLISLPITIVSFGLFALVINALMLSMSAYVVPGFEIDSFWSALFGSLLISLVSTALHSLTNPKPVY